MFIKLDLLSRLELQFENHVFCFSRVAPSTLLQVRQVEYPRMI